MNDIRPEAKRAPAPRRNVAVAAPPTPPAKQPQAKTGQAKGDGANISAEAKTKKQPTGEKATLLEALKSNYGGNDRLQNNDSKLAKMSTDKLKRLKKTREFDKALTKHEEDHFDTAADLARSCPKYKTKTGEDGQEYRVSGKVMIDTGMEKDPAATIKKMKQVRAAALAPDGNVLAPLSDQDKKVAREATEKQDKAQAMLDGTGDREDWARSTGAAKTPGFA